METVIDSQINTQIDILCKSCKQDNNLYGFKFLNKEGNSDICSSCDDSMKYLEMDLIKDKLKFIRKIRCDQCNFRICLINNQPICLWCLNDDIILRHIILYDKYKGKTHAYVLQNDFDYCMNQIKCRYTDSKLTHLTKKVLNTIAYMNQPSLLPIKEKPLGRWM